MKPRDHAPLELSRLLMRRALWVALGAWVLALGLGLQRAATDINQEVSAAMSLAAAYASLAQQPQLTEAEAVGELQRLQSSAPLRHMSLSVYRADGSALLVPAPPEPIAPPMSWLVALHSRWQSSAAESEVSWQVPRADGTAWTVKLTPSRESERIEALENLAGLLALIALGSAALLAAMAWSLRHALQPMRALLEAIVPLRGGDARALARLGPLPTRELEAIRAALLDLGVALEAAQEQRRLLGQKLLSLQEDERQRIARELHDEFGQRLTALRADLSWTASRLREDARALAVVQGMASQCAHIHDDIRGLLRRLQPLAAQQVEQGSTVLRLQQLLQELVQGWQRSAGAETQYELRLSRQDAAGESLPWLAADAAAQWQLPGTVALALYRISQEALTNVARHARARRATLALHWCDGESAPALQWSVCDDGVGIADLDAALGRGAGLAGMRERAWVCGAELQCEAAAPDSAAQPGLRLHARFDAVLRLAERSAAAEPADA